MFHCFNKDISSVPIPTNFNNPFHYSPHTLCVWAADELRAMLQGNELWAADAAKGKMLGVLVVRNSAGEIGYLAGFSGLLCGSNKQPGFVPPVFDFLAPDGCFKLEEARITDINHRIAAIERSTDYAAAAAAVEHAKHSAQEVVAAYKRQCAANKIARDEKRTSGTATETELAALVRQSQFEKAELKRITRKYNERIDEARAVLQLFTRQIAQLATERKQRSAALQEWLFRQFKMLNGRGEEKTLLEIFAAYNGTLPPAGAGECAAPKMLQYAYENNMQPIAMAEFWVGVSPVGEVRRDGCFYPSCKSKCYPILSFMLQGIDVEESALERGGDNLSGIKVVYEDCSLIVVDKPHGVLSVPGIVGGCSVQDWLRATYSSNDIFVVHRLDMATSGLLVAARSMEVFKVMQGLFAGREVEKRYIALLDGVPVESEGEINLPLTADYDHRPCQKVCYKDGKPAKTIFKQLRKVEYGGKECALLSLIPVTGRTHQLRVHCAHHSGLDVPIVGDSLYGKADERLMLHACYIAFSHPVNGERVELSSPAPFQ
ncbi:MAG: RluA family pseudouridine synthase [Bacteroidaceae bacterium]|nr:RluA family pseudouridine synthase [Bacteroidaceae bacterium]